MCNDACIAFAARVLDAPAVAGRRVLEVGSFDTTGTVRPHVESLGPASYHGVDIVPGPSVDELCNVLDLEHHFGPDAFDVIITTEMVEHVRDWRAAFRNLKAVLRPGGLLVVTTRSKGFPYHFGPKDWWRFELEDMRAIAADMDIVALERDPMSPGVFLAARRSPGRAVDLSAIELHSMILGRRASNVSDTQVRRFEWTNPMMLASRLPRPIRRGAKRAYQAVTGHTP